MSAVRAVLRLVAFSTPLLMVPASPGFSWVDTPNSVILGVALAVLSFALLRPKQHPHITCRIGREPGP